MKNAVETVPSPHFPDIERQPVTWARTNPATDTTWEETAKEEQEKVDRLQAPPWLNMAPSRLVKPFGSLEDPLMVLSAYPTEGKYSTRHLDYATVNDVTNQSMWWTLVKLGYHDTKTRKTGALWVDVFPRRLDRNKIPGGGELTKLLSKVPKELVAHWEASAFEFIFRSKALVVITTGGCAFSRYKTYLRLENIDHDMIWQDGTGLTSGAISLAIIEYERESKKTIVSRFVVPTFHARRICTHKEARHPAPAAISRYA